MERGTGGIHQVITQNMERLCGDETLSSRSSIHKEPFPDIPNPIPKDYPMPEGWDESKIYTEYRREDAQD